MLFQPFFRAGNVGTVPGTGLGLAIVQRAVDFHAGGSSSRAARTRARASDFTSREPCVRPSAMQRQGSSRWSAGNDRAAASRITKWIPSA